eukprot:6688535-Pyramimonas_sp.AAC.1
MTMLMTMKTILFPTRARPSPLYCTVLDHAAQQLRQGSSEPTTPPSRASLRRALLGRLLTRVTKEPSQLRDDVFPLLLWFWHS